MNFTYFLSCFLSGFTGGGVVLVQRGLQGFPWVCGGGLQLASDSGDLVHIWEL